MTQQKRQLTAQPMGSGNGPGWYVETAGGTNYYLWAPRPTGPRRHDRGRDYWAAAWDREQGYAGRYERGTDAEDALSCFPDDDEGRAAREVLLAAAREA